MFRVSIFRKKRGQATVEYVLLLVIALFILIGLRDSLFKPFDKWSNDLYRPDGYFACFLQSATLIGMPSPCGKQPELDITASSSISGFTPSSSTSSSLGGSQTNGRPNNGQTDLDNQNKTADNSGEKDEKSESSWGDNAVQSSGSQDLGSTSRFPVSASFNLKNSNRKGSSRKQINRKKKSGIGNDLSSDAPEYIFVYEQNQSKKSKRRKRAFSFQSQSSKNIENDQEGASSAVKKTVAQNKLRRKNHKVSFEKKKSQTNAEIKEEKPMNFGKWIKYILIGLIVAVILTFITLQTKQVYDNLKAS